MFNVITEYLAIDNGGYMYTTIILSSCHSMAEYFLGRCANECNVVHFELSFGLYSGLHVDFPFLTLFYSLPVNYSCLFTDE